ncbi:MAG: pyruvate kinase [bacterium]
MPKEHLLNFRRTRIVATIGPASSSSRMIDELITAGVNLFRMNFSHGDHKTHQDNYQKIRDAAALLDRPIGILQDLQGPKIRVAKFENDFIQLAKGDLFTISCGDDSPGNQQRVGVTYPKLWKDVAAGDDILLDDGRIKLLVLSVDGQDIHTKVELAGKLSNNKGINLPGSNLSLPALTEKDIADLRLGAELGVDWVAVSFVRTLEDVLMARKQLDWAGSTAKLMAKIEKPSAIDNFDAILQNVDGIMVARGDLGVELSPEAVPALQKRIIGLCRDAGKPVVTATQMLESMINSPAPTRAEASDVANAIYDGTDAVMLSAETAAGEYPVEAVQMMNRIALTVENDEGYRKSLVNRTPGPRCSVADSVAHSACDIAKQLGARVIVCFSASGATAGRVSRFRYDTPILVITTSLQAYRQLSVTWGLKPILTQDISNSDEMVEMARRAIDNTKFAEDGDRFVITAGVPFGVKGTTNLIRVERYRIKKA